MSQPVLSLPNGSKGFTLIELLIVVAIIGILSTLGLTTYGEVQKRARDAQRKTDIQQVRIALEVYRSDNSTYPTTAQYNVVGCENALMGGGNIYLQKLPCDPKGNIKYIYTSTGGTYTIVACFENRGDKDGDPYLGRYPNGCTGETWMTGVGYIANSP